MKFLHLSDLHLHDNHSNEDAEALLAFIGENYPHHRLIITGDITDDGDPEQFRVAVKALSPFKGRVHLVPGNHDFGAAGNVFDIQRVRDFDRILCEGLDIDHAFEEKTPHVEALQEDGRKVLLIGLNSNLYTPQLFDFACGEIGATQLEQLDQVLTAPTNRGFKKIVYFHHHPFVIHNPFMEMKDAKELMRVLYLRADVVLFGHRHRSKRWDKYGGIYDVLAADNSPGKDTVREIEIDAEGFVNIKDVKAKP